jgi:hypothetical protein
VNSGGLTWNRQGGGKTIRIDKDDIASVKWMKVPRAYQLEFRIKDGLCYKFIGFREQVIISLLSLFSFYIIELSYARSDMRIDVYLRSYDYLSTIFEFRKQNRCPVVCITYKRKSSTSIT